VYRAHHESWRLAQPPDLSTAASAILLLGRILFVALFAFSARGHIVNHARFVSTAKGRLPVPYVAGWPTAVWLLLAALLMVLGIWADIAALMMAAFLVPTTLLFHRFWTFSDPAQRRTQEGSFYRNVSLLGASLALFALFSVVGAGQFAITGPLLKLGSP
jgi:putative oxidoreductase